MNKRLLTRLLTFFFAAGISLAAGAQERCISLGTGGVTGVYFPAGGAICAAVNRTRKSHGFRCSAEATGGSIVNINSIRGGDMDMGLVQSDWGYHAFHGTTKFKDKGAFGDLRSIVSMHPEPVTIVARPDAGIKGIKDLKGKRFNVGPSNTGIRSTWGVLSKVIGIKDSDLARAATFGPEEMEDALCGNKIDAFMIPIGHPSGLVRNAALACGAKLVPIQGPEIDDLVKRNAFYRKAEIAGGLYDGNPNPTPTYGVGATLVTSASVPEDEVYVVVKSIIENLDAIRKMHPAFKDLKITEMVRDSLTAPLHKGVVKYYKEKGWM
ncbi:MAG: TAXI family TRAP transporter solute-binding subunit [Gammaproteobacteria bacterium]